MPFKFNLSSNNNLDIYPNIKFIADYKPKHSKSRLKIPSKIVFEREYILLGILRNRQSLNESKTVRAVEDCRKLLRQTIEGYFEKKKGNIKSLLIELISGNKLNSSIFNYNDLKEINLQIENIVTNELYKRFNSLILWQHKESSYNWIKDILSPIQKYQDFKKRTYLITSYVESLSRKTLSDTIELLLDDLFLSKLVCELDISTMLLPKLGIDSGLENMELNNEMLNRIGGALEAIKYRLVQELNIHIAKIFYETHDLLLNSTFEHKIHLLEAKVLDKKILNNLMEA